LLFLLNPNPKYLIHTNIYRPVKMRKFIIETTRWFTEITLYDSEESFGFSTTYFLLVLFFLNHPVLTLSRISLSGSSLRRFLTVSESKYFRIQPNSIWFILKNLPMAAPF